jgi:hypothetical protein
MAQSNETGDSTVNAINSIADLLATPLSPNWTIEELAEQLLEIIAARTHQNVDDVEALVLDGDTVADLQSRRLLRPLLACLALKSAAEYGTNVSLFSGYLCFKRTGPTGPVWIAGEFDNRPGSVRVTFRRFDRPPQEPQSGSSRATTLNGGVRHDSPNASTGVVTPQDG